MSHLSVYMLISQLVILGSALLSRNLVHVENHRTYIHSPKRVDELSSSLCLRLLD